MNRRSFLRQSGVLAAAGFALPGLDLLAGRKRPVALPTDSLLEAILQEALSRGAEYAEVRFVRTARQTIQVQNLLAASVVENGTAGYGLRVFLGGAAGFAAADDLTQTNAAEFVAEAIALARAGAGFLTAAPSRSDAKVVWKTPLESDPFAVPLREKAEFLTSLNKSALQQPDIEFAVSNLFLERRETLLATSSGARVEMTQIFTYPNFAVTAVAKKKGLMESRASYLPPQAIGYEVTRRHPFQEEVLQAAQEAREKLSAPLVETGPYALLIDPSHLCSLLDETLGYHLDPDHLLGLDESNPREKMFGPPDVGTFSIAAPTVTITAESHLPQGLASAPVDDEGAAGGSTPLIEHGTVVGLPADASMAFRLGKVAKHPSAYAETAGNPARARLPDLRLQPDPQGKSLKEMIGGMERGLLLKGKGSIIHNYDRQSFMAIPSHAWLIRDGNLTGMVRGVTYRTRLLDFWKGCRMVGTEAESGLWGTLLLEKGLPPQRVPHSVSAPPAQFAPVTVVPSGR